MKLGRRPTSALNSGGKNLCFHCPDRSKPINSDSRPEPLRNSLAEEQVWLEKTESGPVCCALLFILAGVGHWQIYHWRRAVLLRIAPPYRRCFWSIGPLESSGCAREKERSATAQTTQLPARSQKHVLFLFLFLVWNFVYILFSVSPSFRGRRVGHVVVAHAAAAKAQPNYRP